MQKRPTWLIAAAALSGAVLVGCGDDETPTDTSSTNNEGGDGGTPATGGGGSGADGGSGGAGAQGGGGGTADVCGDGVVGSAEACDDDNTDGDDGCDGNCDIEPGYLCTGMPSICSPECGDGLLISPEECDDDDDDAGDGCSATCTVEPGWVCPTEGQDCVELDGSCTYPFGLVLTDNAGALEASATGSTTGGSDDVAAASCDGSSAGGGPDVIYAFTLPDARDVTITATFSAADGIFRVLTAACDPSAAAPGEVGFGDGCANQAGAAGAETITLIGLDAGTYYIAVDGAAAGQEGGFTLDLSAVATQCGDGTVNGAEECDDMNAAMGDGCFNCVVEPLFTCSGMPSVCTGTCGNGTVDYAALEQCDDGNTAAGDRCDLSCALEYDVLDTEPNNSVADAQVVLEDEVVLGSIDIANDFDIYELTLASDSWVSLEMYLTIDGNLGNYDGLGTLDPLVDCTSPGLTDTYLYVFDSTGDVTNTADAIVSDDDAGDGLCPFIGQSQDGTAAFLAAGTYYIRAQALSSSAIIDQYVLDVRVDAPIGQGMACDPSYDLCGALLYCDSTTNTCLDTCGDGVVDVGEQCDDGNAVNGDRCSTACELDFDVLDTEPNDSIADAQTVLDGDIVVGTVPANDFDVYELTLTDASWVTLEVYTTIDGNDANYNGNGQLDPVGDCPLFGGTDPDLFVFTDAADVTDVGEAIVSDLSDGVGSCPFIGANVNGAAALLAAGTYYLRVDGSSSTNDLVQYALDVRLDAVIDQGMTCDPGYDLCDPGALLYCDGTSNTCELSCGNGIVDVGEECDDQNATDDDRCSNTCLLNADVIDVAGNDDFANAQTIAPGEVALGSLDPGNGDDFDLYTFTLASASWVILEQYTTVDGSTANYDGAGLDDTLDCSADPDVHLFDAAGDPTNNGTALASDDLDGDGFCGYLGPNADGAAVLLGPGTYYVKVNEFADNDALPRYLLDLQVAAPLGNGAACDSAYDLCDSSVGLGCDATANVCGFPAPDPIDRTNWEQFTGSADAFDLQNTTLTFTPSGGTYGVIASGAAAGYPDAPGSGTVSTATLTLSDDGSSQRTFGFGFPFYGQNQTSVFVNANGNLTFGVGDGDWDETVAEHFDTPRIAFLYDDLDPGNAGSGPIIVDEYADRLVVTFDGVLERSSTAIVEVQVAIHATGTITITYLNVDVLDCIVGVSAGDDEGNPPDELDFSAQIPVAPIAGDLVINEFLADAAVAANADTNCDAVLNLSDDELVEIVNVSGVPLDLTGVTLSDAAQLRHSFGAVILPHGLSLVVYGGGTPSCGGVNGVVASSGALGLDDGGDTITLSTGDAETFGSSTPGISWTRSPDLTGAFVEHDLAGGASGARFSPGFRVTGDAF